MFLPALPGSRLSVAPDIHPHPSMPTGRRRLLELRTMLVLSRRVTSKMPILVLLIVMSLPWATHGCPLH